jgi:hypothetical protein
MTAVDAANPFAVLSLIVAPAILTNASSVLAMSTSNRLARAADRVRELSRQLEDPHETSAALASDRLYELTAVERRSLLLLGSLRSFYLALGGFASATLVSLMGAVVVSVEWAAPLVRVLETVAVAAGVMAVVALVAGSTRLVQETRIAVEVMGERSARMRRRLGDIGTTGSRGSTGSKGSKGSEGSEGS